MAGQNANPKGDVTPRAFEWTSPAAWSFLLPTPFELEGGEELHDAALVYETWGTPDGSNSVLVFSGMSSGSHMASSKLDVSPGWWERAVGHGKPLDCGRWHLICVSMLGSCYGSTGPASLNPRTKRKYGSAFPRVSIDDNARAIAALLDHLEIRTLRGVVGLSMGGSVAASLVQYFPGRVELLSIVSGSVGPSPHARIWRDIQVNFIQSDPHWNAGDYTAEHWPHDGMVAARRLGVTTYTGAKNLAALEDRLPSFFVSKATNFAKSFDPLCLVRLAEMQNSFKFRADLKSELKGVQIIGSDTDILFPPYQQHELAEVFARRSIPTTVDILVSDNGHDMFLREPERVGKIIRSRLTSSDGPAPRSFEPVTRVRHQ